MVTHHVLVAAPISVAVSVGTAVLRITRRDELPAALAQRTKPVVIENDEIERRLSTLERWRTTRFFGWLIAALIALAIAQQYKLDFGWSLNWKIDRLDGKITLTPPQRP
jgi:hypothetical protein